MRVGVLLGKTLAELRHVPAEEIDQWTAYMSREPLPHEQIMIMLARLLALTRNIHTDTRRAQVTKAADFMPQWWRTQARTPSEMLAIARSITLGMGGAVSEQWQRY